MPAPMHDDFAELSIEPGTSDLPADDPRFALLNVLAFGGAPDRPSHVPEQLGQLGGISISESTGADDALPFWHTNILGDVYLLLLHGEVRVEFKEFEKDSYLGAYFGRAGDLMKFPKNLPHRTFSGDGRRRISLQLAPTDPKWESLAWVRDIAPFDRLVFEELSIEPGPRSTVVRMGGQHIETDSSFLKRGASAIVAYGTYFGHNEFDNGFIISDALATDEDLAQFKLGTHVLRCPREQAVGLLKGVIRALEGSGF